MTYLPEAQHQPYRVLKEVVNLRMIEMVMRMTGSRTYCMPDGQSLFEVLQMIRLRAVPIGSGLGEITVISWEAKTVAGLKGRRFTGCASMIPPREIAHEVKAEVPRSMCGLSVFALPRFVKYICRHELPLLDVDGVSCVFNIYCKLAPDFHMPPIRAFARDKSSYIDACVTTYACDADVAKELFIRLGFLGGYQGWLEENKFTRKPGKFSDIVDDFANYMGKLAFHLKSLHPNVYEEVRSRKNPLSSMLSALFMDYERRFLDALEAGVVAGACVMSLEHDGLVLLLSPDITIPDLIDHLRSNAMLPIAIKEYPSDIVVYLNKLHADHIWVDSRINLSINEIAMAWKVCTDTLRDEPELCGKRNVAFGKILATKLEGRVLVPNYNPAVVEEFDEVGRFWRVSKRDKEEVYGFARQHAHIFAPTFYRHRRGWLQSFKDPVPPDPLLSSGFLNPVATEALMYLRVNMLPLDDPEQVRHQLLFSCGTLYNFRTDSFRRGMPEDRIHRHCPWHFREPEIPQALRDECCNAEGLFDLLFKYYRAGGTCIEDRSSSFILGYGWQRVFVQR